MSELRKTGIDVLGDIPWGSHFCYFYQTTHDLLETLVPYFMAGLKSNEFCLWIISKSELLTLEEAKEALRQVLPDLERYLEQGRIEIVGHDEWFLNGDTFDYHKVANRFKNKLDEALAKGYTGMRINGSPAWLQKENRMQFCQFEKEIGQLFPNERIIASCTFPLATLKGDEIFDITRRHQFAIAKRYGHWEVIETPELKQAKAEIKKLNEELEQKVTKRTRQLESANNELRNENAERKKAEEELRKSKDRIRLIIDTIPIMAFTVRLDGTVDYYNQRWLDYAGESAIEDPNSIVHPEDRPAATEKWRTKMITGELSEGEIRLRRSDGEYRWFLVRTAPLYDEQRNIVKWYGVSIDIEDSKRAEDALRDSEQRYLALFENMAEGVAYFKMLFKDGKLQDAIYLEMNPAWENLTGLGNVIGRKITEVIPGILEANSEFIERSARVALTGKSERFESYSIYLKKWLSTSAYSPKKEHVIVVMDDITKRKQAEETLQQSYEEIRRLTEHLHNIREDERTHIAREIHDELGSQLAVLKMDVSWLKKKLNDAGEAIKQRIRDLIDLLDATVKSVRRISSELRPSLLDNLGLVAAMEWHLKEFEKRSGIKITFNEPKEELKIPDPIKNGLFRIFQESLTNVTRHSDAKEVKVKLLYTNHQLILNIEDNGKGFDKQKVKEMKTLGILGMEERAMMMNGSYEINSVPGKGTIVTAVLPYKNEKVNSI
ncbi:MAG: hypothetical protein JWN83_1505 [Chitinophagaceae bacterium]|nr:hypothetical protein [Chitinophagaceae bacterium]